MKKKPICLLGSIAVLAATLFPAPLPAEPNAPKAAAQKAEKQESRERHPEIRQAIRALERAKRRLENAAHDFGGHREKALKAVNEAIEQLKLALQYDKE